MGTKGNRRGPKKSDKFEEPETYFFGSELVENHFLVDVEELGYNSVRFKVTHKEGTEEYTVEIVE